LDGKMRMTRHVFKTMLAVSLVLFLTASALGESADKPGQETIILRAWDIPRTAGFGVAEMARLAVIRDFQEKYPHVRPVSSKGLEISGRQRVEDQDIVPLMQIAGDIAPDVMLVGFRQADTYVRQKFLYPLDKYIEESTLGLKIADAPLLELDEYLKQLEKSPLYKEQIAWRVPRICWEIMRRRCPYEEECPFCRAWGVRPAKEHYHVWAFPQRHQVMVMFYRRDLFREAGLPDRAPETMAELMEFTKKLTDPEEDRSGLRLSLTQIGLDTSSFLYSFGGRLVEQDTAGQWRCAFDSEQAVEAYYFVARLFNEPFTNSKGKTIVNVVDTREGEGPRNFKIGMFLGAIQDGFFPEYRPEVIGFGPVPRGPDGLRGSGFSSEMTGIYAGLAGQENEKIRRAAWDFILYYNGTEARKTWVRNYVEFGQPQCVYPELLEQAGYPEYVRQVPEGWLESAKEAFASTVPIPYGRNCHMVFKYASKAIDQIRTDNTVKEAIKAGDATRAKDRIREILKDRVKRSNEKMLNIITPRQHKIRATVASVVAALILISFVFMFRRVFRTFTAAQIKDPTRKTGKWEFGRYKWAYILALPAIGSIALWMYYPLARGSIMAFQNYNVRGFSEWVGMDNFGNALFNDEFWYSVWVSFKYTMMFALFGFFAPIVLAFLLTEVPKGSLLFRSIYYLPMVLSGVIVVFLWKGFYGQYGMINSVLNFFIGLLNMIPGVAIEELRKVWLEDPAFALFFLLLPVIWAGMGPGCLIYLAALKTVPDELYEAADIDGAGILQKALHVAIPSIKSLIMINFVGVMVATIRGGSEFALAMTGGGPYSPYGQTEVVGLHIFWEAFGYLRFGSATAMAWLLGTMLIGFTVLQLQRLSRMEFRAAGGGK